MHLSKKQTVGAFALLVLAVLGVGAYLLHLSSRESVKKEPKRIGILQLTEAIDAFPDGMKQGLKDFGYVDGLDVVYDYQNIREDISKAPEVAQRFVDADVDLMFVITNPSLAAALDVTKKSGKQIPIVFVGVDKPVEQGLIASFSSTGNNSTGIMGSVTDNVAKQLSILREMAPEAKRIGSFGRGFYIPEGIGGLQFQALLEFAPQYGFEVIEYTTDAGPDPAKIEAEIERITAGIQPGDISALMHIAGHYHPTQHHLEYAIAEKLQGVITVEPTIEEVKQGGIMGYAPNLYAVGRDTAVLIDKIFRGAKPSEVPVESPRRNELWINLDAARRAGVTIPDSVLSKASNRIGE